MKIFTTVALSTLLLASSSSFAASITLGQPNYGGSGCPAGSASATVSPDGQELSILFDKFVAKNGRKNCGLVIPIKVPNGFQVAIYTMDYRGYVAPKTTGRLTTDYFFAGQRSRPITRRIQGEKDYTERDTIASMTNVWSKCGDSVNLRVNAGMAASGKGEATVDSVDMSNAGLVYHLTYRACH